MFEPKQPRSLEQYVVAETETLRNALRKINDNHMGFVFALDDAGSVVGVATDGDVRRALLNGYLIESVVSECMNRKFFWADEDTPREQILKKLDNEIQFIPLLDDNGRLKDVISRDYLPTKQEKPVYVRALAPVRISFGGGGSDLTHFFTNSRGAVINAAITMYCHATLRIRDDEQIQIYSLDLEDELKAESLEQALQSQGQFGLVLEILRLVNPDYGFDLYLNSDFKIGSGLGGSASVAVAILACFNHLRRDQWDRYELAELAFQAERIYLGVAGGWQDQYAAVFGGANFIEFDKDQHIVNPIRMDDVTIMELQESLVLCDTGILHDSGNIHVAQKKSMESTDTTEQVKKNVELVFDIKNHLLRGKTHLLGEDLHKAWQLKRSFSEEISTPEIDSIYQGALKNGANGGKLLGAGGGGYFLFHVSPFNKNRLCKYLNEIGLTTRPVFFDTQGCRSWSLRQPSELDFSEA